MCVCVRTHARNKNITRKLVKREPAIIYRDDTRKRDQVTRTKGGENALSGGGDGVFLSENF